MAAILSFVNPRTIRDSAMLRLGRAVIDVLWQSEPDPASVAWIRTRYGLLGELANADRIVTSHEVELVSALMQRDRLSTAACAVALAAFDDGRRNRLHAAALIEQLLRSQPTDATMFGQLFDDLLRMALCDGRLRRAERDWLIDIGSKFNMDAHGIDARLRGLAEQRAAA